MSIQNNNHTCDTGAYGPCDACERESRLDRGAAAMRRISIPLLRKLHAAGTTPNVLERLGWLEIEKAKEAARWEIVMTLPLLLDALEAFNGGGNQ